jgi:CheY-like chemotaxis protein
MPNGGGGVTPLTRSLLVVEDDTDTASTYRVLLESFGYRVHTAQDAASALAVLRTAEVDVVLCDLGLPGPMSGLDLAEAMHHDPDLREVPLVAITGFGQPHDRELTAAAGFAAHLVKPVEPPVLQEVLRGIAARMKSPMAPNRAKSARHHPAPDSESSQ